MKSNVYLVATIPIVKILKRLLLNFSTPILDLPRVAKRLVVLSVDIGLCIFTVWIAYYLRLGEFVPLSGNALFAVVVSIAIALPIFITSGLYRAIFRYSGWTALISVAQSIVIYGLLYAAIFTAIGITDVPRTIGIIQPILLLIFVGASRAFARMWLGDQYKDILKRATRPKSLIYGAGRTGSQLAEAIANDPELCVIGFLDDDSQLHGQILNGRPIYNPSDLNKLVQTLSVSDVFLAMPNISRKRKNEIIENMRTAQVSVSALPRMADLAQGKVRISDLRELGFDDLLGRDPVTPDNFLLKKNISGKTVLVTGAGGSIGSELCRQIAALSPKRVLLVEQNEFALYVIHLELEKKLGSTSNILVPLLGNVQDETRMRDIISAWRPDTIYHAAAYKHVPLVEHNLSEGIKNNVFGTLKIALVSAEYCVPNFVLVSSDKAVRPTNIMGASKRLAEMILQALSVESPKTTYSMVRFGNVLDSSGSVVPKFRQQIKEGGPITLTHSDITRFFMTIPEAAQLVIQASALAKGGDVFVLNMGEPIRIYDLALRMIELSGLTVKTPLNPEGDIEIVITGLRPGEKLFEELLIGNNPQLTSHPSILKAEEQFIHWTDLAKRLASLKEALKSKNLTKARRILEEVVSGYSPKNNIIDLIHIKQETDSTI